MYGLKIRLTAISAVALIILALFGQTEAQRTTRVNERDARETLRRLAAKVDDFRYLLDNELRRAGIQPGTEDDVLDSLDAMQQQVTELQNKLSRRRDSPRDVSNLQSQARTVEDNLRSLQAGAKLRREWDSTRELVDKLADNYGVTNDVYNNGNQNPNANLPDRNYPNYPDRNVPSGNFNNGLTGTYQLDSARSQNVADVVDRAAGNSPDRDLARADLQEKLEAPQMLALETRGNQVTLASSIASQVTVTADGRDRTETLADGRTLRVRTSLRGQELTLSSSGGENDYNVTFLSIDNGRSLKVTRRVTSSYLNQTVVAESYYTKTDSVARYDISNGGYVPDNTSNYPNNGGNGYPPSTRPGRTGTFVVPNGTILTGTLDNEINTKLSQNNDRFTMTVNAPTEYRGAVIEGYISGINRSGKISGRSQLTFNFERIRLSDGTTYDFAGYLQSVTDASGKTVKIDNEGTAKGDNQTTETAKRGGIGAGLGAIIGAIAGGAKGAAIGAIIGGGAGAGSVYIQGKDDLELKPGSSVTVQSSSPIR